MYDKDITDRFNEIMKLEYEHEKQLSIIRTGIYSTWFYTIHNTIISLRKEEPVKWHRAIPLIKLLISKHIKDGHEKEIILSLIPPNMKETREITQKIKDASTHLPAKPLKLKEFVEYNNV
jgi:hypothetical protein